MNTSAISVTLTATPLEYGDLISRLVDTTMKKVSSPLPKLAVVLEERLSARIDEQEQNDLKRVGYEVDQQVMNQKIVFLEVDSFTIRRAVETIILYGTIRLGAYISVNVQLSCLVGSGFAKGTLHGFELRKACIN